MRKDKLIIFKFINLQLCLFIITSSFILPLYALASGNATPAYVPLAPIPTYVDTVNFSDVSGNGLSTYLGNAYRLGVGIATVLAVIMIMWGGIEYMSTDAMGGKEDGKEKINN